jgi:hypothetical protein
MFWIRVQLLCHVRLLVPLSTAFLLAALSSGAGAVSISIFSTGLDSVGNPLSGGTPDPHYQVLETGNQAVVRTDFRSTYFPNDSNSQWIWENANGQPISVTRTFRTNFDLAGLDPNTAVIIGRWGTDNTGIDILLNEISTGISLPGEPITNFSELHSFTISDDFHAGLNTLDFIVRDVGVMSGFRAELELVPEPATAFLFALGLVGIEMIRRRRRLV